MKTLLTKTLTALLLLFLAASVSAADNKDYTLHKYAPGNGGILTNVAPDGKWAVINLGTTSSGMTCPSELFNMATGEHFTVKYNGRELSFGKVSNEDADGFVTIVGSMSSRPMSYRFKPSEPATPGTIHVFANRTNWTSGTLTAVTPDGKYGVGHFTGYTGQDIIGAELNGDYWFDGLFANLETGEVLPTPGTPTADRNGQDQHAMKFNAITPDGKFILGEREWFMPSEGFPFIYDVEKQDFQPISFTKQGNRMVPDNGIEYLDFPFMSPNGRYVGGIAVAYSPVEGSDFASETKMPYRYDLQTGEMKIFQDTESANIEVGCIDDNGTIFGNPDTGSPLRHFKIFYQDKYWISFAQLCQQYYGFNFSEKSGFEFSGTATSVTGDGRRFIAFSDPMGESYAFDFGAPVEEVCSNFDLLSNYTVTPAQGSAFSKMASVEFNFGRAVQVLGKGNTHLHLYKKDGTKVRDGLSTTGESGGLHLKSGSSTVVVGTFRTTVLENGEEYYVVLDAGAVAPANDAAMANKEIRISYTGRNDAPVKIVSSVPENGSSLNHLDATTSYILLTFDCPIKLTNNYEAYLERIEEGGHTTRIATLSLASGNTESTKNQLLIYPTSSVYLYEGVNYRVVLSEGSVSDYAGTETSHNEAWSIDLTGTYIREIATETTMFVDDFNDPNASLAKWLLYEGDHRTPLAEQQAWGCDADNTPWNFSTHDDEANPNYYATSHSLYAPSGQSDDWMMTPQLHIPTDGKAILEFDAEKLKADKDDHLLVYIFPEERQISYLNDNNMAVVKDHAQLLADISDLNSANGMGHADGLWKHYSFKLSEWAGKDIYIAFVNQNNNQSAVLVDNVIVQKETLYSIGFSNDDRVVGKDAIDIKGTFTITTPDFASGALSLVLKNSEGTEVSRIEWPSISGTSIKDRPIPMNFTKPLPLTIGKENKFTIDITFDGKDASGQDFKRQETFQGSISDLAFTPVKRVVLEELTGVTCPNCPLGIIAIEACERQYKDQFIPISIHAYDGDNLGAEFQPYARFIGLNAAPSARINRIAGTAANAGIYYPMTNDGSKLYYDLKEQELWYNIIAQELDRLSICDVTLKANYEQDGKEVHIGSQVRYALDANHTLSVFAVLLEDGIVSYQESNFAGSELEGLGEWGVGGIYSAPVAYPVTHNDVVRQAIGQSFAGTLGLLPQSFEANKTYDISFNFNTPASLSDPKNASVVLMLIDTQTGEIINAAKAKVMDEGDGIESITLDAGRQHSYYNLAGQRVAPTTKGIVIQSGKKQINK